MSDDPLLDPPDPDEQRAALLHIIGYRRLRRSIRSSATGALVWGGLMLFLWYRIYYLRNQTDTPFAVIHLCLGLGELIAGLWKKLFPTPEAHLFDGLVLLGFAGANGYRLWDAIQRGRGVDGWYIGLAVIMALSAVQHFRQYAELRRARFRRPGAAQLRWFDELLDETRAADPENDANSLDLSTRPPLRVKLLGDTTLVLAPGDDDPAVVSRDGFRIDREAPPAGGRPPTGFVSIEGEDAGSFPLDEYNWKNYAAWKTAGGDPPPPLRPVDAAR